jgi:predicted RNA-binding Zn-ribbon protein involved in translation (DUF1610 family)
LPAIGHRRGTLDCPHCGRPTSVYAVLHHCPECGLLLESPLRQRGSHARCPWCQEQLPVPSDALFNDDREPPDPSWFAFACPSCSQELRARPRDANTTAVCPDCLRPLTVPTGGEAVVPPSSFLPDSPELHRDEPRRRCPHCDELIARRAKECRACGAQFS